MSKKKRKVINEEKKNKPTKKQNKWNDPNFVLEQYNRCGRHRLKSEDKRNFLYNLGYGKLKE